jgi:hypothetical protein
VSVHGVRGARDAVEIEADAHFDPDRRDVGEGALRQILAAELLPGELRPRQAAFGHVRLELKRLPAALDLEGETFGEGFYNLRSPMQHQGQTTSAYTSISMALLLLPPGRHNALYQSSRTWCPRRGEAGSRRFRPSGQ